MTNRRRRVVVSALLAMVAAVGGLQQTAHADPILEWSYDLYTRFEGTNVFTAGSGTQIQLPGQVSWGAEGVSVFAADSGNPNTNRSGITISNPVNQDQSAGPAIVTGTYSTNALTPATGAWITHHNKPISGNFATLDRTVIASTLTLTPTNPPGSTFPSATIDFNVEFAETPNATPCAASSPAGNPCNDIFALLGDNFNQAFTFGDTNYFISIFPTAGPGIVNDRLPFLGKSVCNAAGAPDNCVGFTTVEGQDTSIQFGFRITSQKIDIDVPEPGTLVLLGLSLTLLGLARRRIV